MVPSPRAEGFYKFLIAKALVQMKRYQIQEGALELHEASAGLAGDGNFFNRGANTDHRDDDSGHQNRHLTPEGPYPTAHG